MAEGMKTVAGAVKSAVPQMVQRPVPAGYGLAYQMGGPNYMYGVTPRFGAYYRDGGMPPGQIHGNMPGSREGADMFGFWPTMFQSSPYATASQMYTPGLGVMPLIGYPSRYPHVIMGGYTDYGAPIANQAMGMMLPLLMMGLYRQMFPMPGMPGAAGGAGGRGGAGGSGGGRGDGKSGKEWVADKEGYKFHYPGAEADWDGYASPSTRNVPGWGGRVDAVGPFQGTSEQIAAAQAEAQAAAAAQAQAAAAAQAQATAQSVVPGLAKSASQVKEAAKPWYRSAIDYFKSSSWTPQAQDAPVPVNRPVQTVFGHNYY